MWGDVRDDGGDDDDDDVCFTVMGVRRAEYVVWNEASRARDGGARPRRMSDD